MRRKPPVAASPDLAASLLRLCVLAEYLCEVAPDQPAAVMLRDDAAIVRRMLQVACLTEAASAARDYDFARLASMVNAATATAKSAP